MKVCASCSESKTLDKFSKDRSKSDGHQKWCKACYKAYRDHFKAGINARGREYRQENLDKCLAKEKAYRAEHKEAHQAYVNEWKKANPDKVREYRRIGRERANLSQ